MPFSFAALLQHAAAQGSRSTVLRPLGWLLGICVTAAVACVEVKAPSWLITLFGVSSAVTVLLYLVAYIFCLIKDRDALRTERYSIQKLAMEKGYATGDSITGLLRHEMALGQGANVSGETKQ
jgi:hypothetical protein